MTLRYLSINKLSEITGVDRRTIKSRLAHIDPYKKEKKAILYDAHIAIPIVVGFADQSDKTTDKQLLEAKLRTEIASAEKIEFDNAIKRSEYVHIEDVTRTVDKEYAYIRSSLYSIPSKLAKPIAAEDDPSVCQSMLKKQIDETLNHLQADVRLNIQPEEVDEKYFPEEE